MATQATNVVSITCSVCEVSVKQTVGSRRTICPNCGHFFDPAVAAAAGLRSNGNPQQRSRYDNKQQDDRLPTLNSNERQANKSSGSRLQTIANFFHKLGSSSSGKQETDSGISSENSYASPNHSSKNLPSESSQLPPIREDTKGRLIASPRYASYNQQSSYSRQPSSKSSSSGHSGNNQNEDNGHQSISQILKAMRTDRLRSEVKMAEDTSDWTSVKEFYSLLFNSFQEINLVFKKEITKEYRISEDPGIKLNDVYEVYDILENLVSSVAVKKPQEIQKQVLKSIINSLLKDHKVHSKDDLRAYLVLTLNPQFSNLTTYVIFAHLLRQIAALPDQDHHYLVLWLKKLESGHFQRLVQNLHNFVSCRLFPPKPQDLPPMTKCSWWIPSAIKVLALLNGANSQCRPPIISPMEFYNSTLDHIDLMAEYYTWQSPAANPGFSFCQYPFCLSLASKRSILQRDSEQQMIIMARRSLVAKVQRREMPDIGMLFLNLTVRRSHLVSDSLNEIARKQHDLKKKLKVTFSGEPGLDMGGLTKEWFLLLIRQIFQPEYGMFTFDKKSGVYWFSSSQCDNYREFNLVGVLMGLAVYNSIILDIHFPPICYKKLLSPAVVPYNDPNAAVGITPATLNDLRTMMPDLARGLQELLDYEGDVEEDFGLTFQTSYTEFGSVVCVPLKEDGEKFPVTNSNRKEYVQLYVNNIINKSINSQFRAFYHGFHSVCASNALIMLRPDEVELLVCGSPTLDMGELMKVTTYDGYSTNDPPIKYFWEVVSGMSCTLQKQLLLFATGSDRIPIGGMSEMQFKITRIVKTEMLPVSHTCFNQIILPAYRSKKTLRQKLLIAIQNAEGFGLE